MMINYKQMITNKTDDYEKVTFNDECAAFA